VADRRTVLQPFDSLTAIPDDLDVEYWNGGEPPADDVRVRVELYVMPYTFDPSRGEIMTSFPRLSVVQTLTAGYEHVLPYLPDGVTLCNARGVHDASTAELAVTLTLASLRRIPEFVRAQQREEWAFGLYDALADKTVLLVGYGSVGKAVERRLEPFECDVLRVARTARDGIAGFDALPSLLRRADVVILTVPLNDETRRMVDADFLASMRDRALLVNVARGGVVDTDALLAELRSGRLTAAVDVTDPEPPPPRHPLWTAPGLLISPHVGGSTTAFEPRARRLVLAQLERFAAGEPLTNVVAAPTRGVCSPLSVCGCTLRG
jgi:phosphoglycerate dehydrogenase-like enzyme